jgi:Ala-tRNA(Pro) deacylase
MFEDVPEWLLTLLDQSGTHYEVIEHRRDVTADEAAADTKTPFLDFAKTVMVHTDDQDVIVVLPARHRIVLSRLAKALGRSNAELVPESRLGELFPDCEIGAMPPFSFPACLPVIVAAPIAVREHITFNAGSHECAVRMRYADYDRLVQPRVADFTVES